MTVRCVVVEDAYSCLLCGKRPYPDGAEQLLVRVASTEMNHYYCRACAGEIGRAFEQVEVADEELAAIERNVTASCVYADLMVDEPDLRSSVDDIRALVAEVKRLRDRIDDLMSDDS